MPAVNGVGEPCAGEPHARFEVAGTGNGADLAKDTGVAQPAGKPAATKAPGPKASEPPRQSPTLHPGYPSRSCSTWVALAGLTGAPGGWKVPARPKPGLATAERELSVPEGR
jgi:hypothetical protein